MMKLLDSFLRAFKLLLLFYLGGTAVLPYLAWFHLLLAAIGGLAVQSGIIFALHGLLAGVALIGGLVWFATLNFIYTLLLKLLWSKPPSWTRLVLNKQDLLLNYGIGSIGCIGGAVLMLVLLSDRYGGINVLVKGTDVDQGRAAVQIMVEYWWLWFLSVVSLYHVSCSTKHQQTRASRS